MVETLKDPRSFHWWARWGKHGRCSSAMEGGPSAMVNHDTLAASPMPALKLSGVRMSSTPQTRPSGLEYHTSALASTLSQR